jgi:N-acetyltransferase
MPTSIQRTYAGRNNALPRKRPLSDDAAVSLPAKRPRVLGGAKRTPKPRESKKQNLIQLHFCTDRPILRTCPLCSLSYTKGAPDDEALHATHCARVQKGMEWGREEERECTKAGVTEVATGLKLKSGIRGRIISFRTDVGGRIGSKVSLHSRVQTSLMLGRLQPF